MKRGLVLEGGGAKGSFHIGAVKALFEMGYTFDGVSGTSIGAFNAAMIASGDFEKLMALWNRVDTAMLFDFDDSALKNMADLRAAPNAIAYMAAQFKKFFGAKGIDTTKIKQLISDNVDEEKLRASPTDFAMVTVSFSDLKPFELRKEEIPRGQLADYIMASASFPGFRTSPIGERRYIDGGVYNNLPIDVLVDQGYEEITAVRTFSIGRIKKPKKIDGVKILYILPPEPLGSILIFDQQVIQKNIRLGYFEARRVMLGHGGRYFYLADMPPEEKIFEALCRIPEETLGKIGQCLGLPQMEGKRLLFEKVLPLLAAAFRLGATARYGEILLAAMEQAAKEAGIERFVLYPFSDFARRVWENCEKEEGGPPLPVIGALMKQRECRAAAPLLLRDFCRAFL